MIRTMLLIILTAFIISGCNSSSENKMTVGVNTTVNINDTDTTFLTTKPIRCILQDKAGSFWFGTDGDGVCRYAEKSFTWFTEKEGLCNNFVWTILEDKNGNLLFGTQNGICRYDGKSFTT